MIKRLCIVFFILFLLAVLGVSVYVFLFRKDQDDKQGYLDDLSSIEEIFYKLDTTATNQLDEALASQIEGYKYKKVIFDNDKLKIVRFSKHEDGDKLTAGGCILNASKYLFSDETGKYYEITLSNIILLMNPKERADYLSVLKFYKNFNPNFCGITTYYALNDYVYMLPETFRGKCILEGKYSLKSELEEENGKVTLIYFEENIQQPLKPSEYLFTIEDNEGSIKYSKTLYECSEGLVY